MPSDVLLLLLLLFWWVTFNLRGNPRKNGVGTYFFDKVPSPMAGAAFNRAKVYWPWSAISKDY